MLLKTHSLQKDSMYIERPVPQLDLIFPLLHQGSPTYDITEKFTLNIFPNYNNRFLQKEPLIVT